MTNSNLLKNPIEEPGNIADFIALHYPTSEHKGMLHIWAKGKRSGKMYRYYYGEPLAALAKATKDRIARSAQDYYITANTMSAGTRDKDNIFSLNNIVIDIDNHGGTDPEKIRRQYDTITEYYKSRIMDGSGAYIPNTIVYTGRGVQLWYAIEQISYKRLDIYETLTGEILRQAGEMLEDNPETLQGLALDPGASRNAAGLFRAPWSYNRKARKKAEYIILHDDLIEPMEEAREIRKKEKKGDTKIINYQTAASEGRIKAISREASIIQLVRIRQDKGETIERDNILFCISCIWGKVCQDDAEIMERVKRANRLFNNPMGDKELNKIMRTALKKRYTAKNKTIIDRLKITEEEQETINFYAGTGRTAEREKKRAEKAARDKQAIKLYEEGATQEDIAAALKISRRTVCNILERNHARKCDTGRLFEREAYTDDKKTDEPIESQETAQDEATGARTGERGEPLAKMCKKRPIYCGNNAAAISGAAQGNAPAYLRIINGGRASGDPVEAGSPEASENRERGDPSG